MKIEKRAIKIASAWALFLAVLKFTTWIISWSMTILASAVDSLLDLIISAFNLLALKEASKPADKEHNYWHWKIEGLVAVIEWLIIIGSWWVIIYSSIKKLIFWTIIQDIDIGIYVMLASILVTWIIVFFLYSASKKTKNLVIRTDLMHYTMDFLTNTWVILALVLIKFTWLEWIDPIVGIWIAIYIIYSCINVFKDWYDLLMDTSIGKDEEISKIILKNKNIENFHKLKTHKSWWKTFISFHLVFKDKEISLRKANEISYEIENNLKKHFKNASIMVRLDPYDEKYW